jgi:hypothetical protein
MNGFNAGSYHSTSLSQPARKWIRVQLPARAYLVAGNAYPTRMYKMYGMLFDDPFSKVIEEGPVRVSFGRADNDRVKLNITIDFSKNKKMNEDPHEAALAMGKVIVVLRKTFKVDLDDIKV